jgi:hypothetical protein
VHCRTRYGLIGNVLLRYCSTSPCLQSLIYGITSKTWIPLMLSTFNINSERSCDELSYHICQ